MLTSTWPFSNEDICVERTSMSPVYRCTMSSECVVAKRSSPASDKQIIRSLLWRNQERLINSLSSIQFMETIASILPMLQR